MDYFVPSLSSVFSSQERKNKQGTKRWTTRWCIERALVRLWSTG